MRRRAYLSAAGAAGLAGCLSAPGGLTGGGGPAFATLADVRVEEYEELSDVPGVSEEEAREAREEHDDPPTVMAPYELELALDAEILRERLTADKTARLAVSVTNERDETFPVDHADYTVLGSRVSRSEEHSQLVLWPLEREEQPERASEDCFKMTTGVAYAPDSPGAEYAPGERKRNRYDLWMDHQATECFPPREYRFGQLYRTHGDELSVDVDGWIVLRWAVVVELAAP